MGVYETENEPLPGISLWDWFNLYFSGILLVIFLLGHIWIFHYSPSGGEITYEGVIERLRSPLAWFLDLGLLGLSLYHGLAGLRRVVLDLEILNPKGERILLLALVAIGVSALIYGLTIFRAFLS